MTLGVALQILVKSPRLRDILDPEYECVLAAR